MNCRDLEKLLGEGRPPDAAAESHIAQCAGCRTLLQALEVDDDPMDDAMSSAIRVRFSDDIVAVRPLPADGVLIAATIGLFTIFSLLLASIVGLQGFYQLTASQRLLYYTCVGAFGILFSISAVQCVIPGAKVRVSRTLVAIGSVVSTGVLVTVLFRTFELDNFVAHGIPCLRFGCVCAAIFGLVAAPVTRRGYVTDLRTTSILLGCFAGFSGVAVLSLHCPIENSAHIIVWHLGAVAVSALGAFLIGAVLQRRNLSRIRHIGD